MAESPLNAEQVAAFLDGRLSDAERAVVLAQLAESPEWQDIVVDAAAVRDTNALITPARATSAPRFRFKRGLLLAAAAGFVVFVTLWNKGRAGVNGESPAVTPTNALALAVADGTLRELSTDRWSVVRSASNDVDELARAVRLGALSVDAVLDRTGAGAVAREEMLVLLQELNASAARQLVASARDSASFDVAFASVRALVNTDAYDAGVWLELLRAGSVAARENTNMIQVLQSVARTKQLSPERATELSARIRRLEDVLPSAEPSRVREAATDVMKILAS